jgi:hypothetical protein
MTSPLSTLEQDLGTLVTTAGVAKDPLTAAQDVLSLLADQTLVGTDISGGVALVYNTIANAINNDVVSALNGIAGALSSISIPATVTLTDVASALSSLQNVLQTAQTLVPGGSSAAASALASTSQFATLFGNLLQDAGTLLAAADTLYEIAQQLAAVAATLKTAAQGNP